MHKRPYMRDGVPDLPFEKQEAAMLEHGIDISLAYIDRLSKPQIKRKDPAELKNRIDMLKPTTRKSPELIVVAELRCLGWDVDDVCKSLHKAGHRNAAVLALDVGKTYTAESLRSEIVPAIGTSDKQHRRGQNAGARAIGVAEAAKRRAEKRSARLAIAEPMWGEDSRKVTNEMIVAKCRLSERTIYKWLGPRTDARKKLLAARKHARK